MNTYLIGAILALVYTVGAVTIGDHFGSLSSAKELANYKTAVEVQHAAQLDAVAKDYQAQLLAAQTNAAHQQGVIDDLNTQLSKPDPNATDLARRVLNAQAASSAGRCVMPKAGTSASGTQSVPTPSPDSDSSAQRLRELTQAVYDAAIADDKHFDAAVKLLP